MFFEVGLYKVHIYSRSVPCRNHRSAQPQFGEAESHSSPDAQLYISVRPAFLLALHFLNRRTSGCTDQWIQIDYRYVLYMAPLQKTQTISLSTESTCPRPAGGLRSVLPSSITARAAMLWLETGLCLAGLSPTCPISIPCEQTLARILKPSMLDKHDFLLRLSSSLGRSGWSEWLKDATGPEDLKVCCS